MKRRFSMKFNPPISVNGIMKHRNDVEGTLSAFVVLINQNNCLKSENYTCEIEEEKNN